MPDARISFYVMDQPDNIIIAILSMPFVPGQASGLIAGVIIVALYSSIYLAMSILAGTRTM
jgi:hypothetical protein